MKKPFFFSFAVFMFLSVCAQSTLAQALLSQNGKALMPIIVSANASEEIREQATTLAEYLQKISSARFEVREGDSSSGIVLGTTKEFSAFADQFSFTPETREDYLLRSHENGVYLIGVSELGTSHAVWDFLYRLGHRAFFPGEKWEVIPSEPNLRIDVDAKEHPSFLFRRIFFGSGTWPENTERWEQWKKMNRMEGGVVVNTGHSWNAITKEYQEEFDLHPEYFALIDGKRQFDAAHKKFCISNPGLRDLVGRYALDFFAKNPAEESVSIDPSDFGNWCLCEPCLAIGTPSDRQTVLANQTITTVRAQYPHKYVAFYSYYDHSPPPSIEVEPGVIVSVATSFIRGNFTFEELVEGWRNKGAEIGTRDYMSVIIWDFDLPNESKAGQLDGMPLSLAHYHKLGTRFYIAEAGDSWAPNGLGYYLASRILWNVNEAEEVEELFSDFIEKAFADAQEPMREFYQLLTGIEYTTGLSFNNEYLGRLYTQLAKAKAISKNSDVQARISDLALYLQHLENYLAFREAEQDDKRQQAFETLMRHAYRIRETHMVFGNWYYRRGFHQNTITLPKGVSLNSPEENDPWKSSKPFTSAEIEEIIRGGQKRNPTKNEKWKVELIEPLKTSHPESTLRVRGKQTILLHALQTGEVSIASHLVTDSAQYLTNTYSILDLEGRLIKKGVLQADAPINFQATAGQSFLFNVFSGVNEFNFTNAAAAYRTDIYRPLLPPGVEGLYFFRKGGTVYVNVPEGTEEWMLKLTTQTPGETAKITVWDPQGKEKAVFKTSKQSQEAVTLGGPAGFWRIDFGKAETGALYKVLLSLDKSLSPWVSVDSQHPLRITNIAH